VGRVMWGVAVAALAAALAMALGGAGATSVKIDFLPGANVRTDPLVTAQPQCVSDHIHTFYGAVDQHTVRPTATYGDLRRMLGNTGIVAEDKSLYWHPTIYRRTRSASGQPRYVISDIWFASSYYVWDTGAVRAFPSGFKMKVRSSDERSRAFAECVDGDERRCERADKACGRALDQDFLPSAACAELEMSISFPTCWDGVRLESEDGMSHVAFDLEEGEFDGECPDSHPVKLPQLQFFTRIEEYQGGEHVFSDETGDFHVDFFSGWDEKKLQGVLDSCENHSFEALPDAFCEDFLTFRGNLPHVTGTGDEEEAEEDEFTDEEDEFTDEEDEFTDEEDEFTGEEDDFTDEEDEFTDEGDEFIDEEDEFTLEDGDIAQDLRKIQPEKLQTQRLVSPEKVSDIATLPRGACSGILLPDGGDDNGDSDGGGSGDGGGDGAGNLCEMVNEEFVAGSSLPQQRMQRKQKKGQRRKWRRACRSIRDTTGRRLCKWRRRQRQRSGGEPRCVLKLG